MVVLREPRTVVSKGKKLVAMMVGQLAAKKAVNLVATTVATRVGR